MKKKVYYKLNRYKVAKVEVESVEQEQAVKILNRETDRFAKSEDTYYEKCSSLDEMYEETGFEPADNTPSPEEQMIRASEQNELKVRIQKAIEKLKPRQREMVLMIFFEEKEETYSSEMKQYLAKLSVLQREVLRLISIGFEPREILDELHINKKQYEDCYNAIHSYRNISVLM